MLKSESAHSVFKFIGSTASISITNFILLGTIYYNYGLELFSLFSFMFLIVNFSYGILNGTVLTTLQVNSEHSKCGARVFAEHLKIFYAIALVIVFVGFLFIYNFSSHPAYSLMMTICIFLLCARWFSRSSFLISKCTNNAFDLDRNMAVATSISAISSFFLDEMLFLCLFTAACFVQLAVSVEIIKFIPRSLSISKKNSFIREFSKSGKFSFFGILCTEITTNFFMYFTAFAYGSKKFAVLSMCMMCFRPIQIVISSISASERPNIKNIFEKRNLHQRDKYINKILLCALSVNVFIAYGFVFFNENYKIVQELINEDVIYILAVLSCMYLIKSLRVFPTLVLQYFQYYGFIFKVTCWAAFVTILINVLGFYSFDVSYIVSVFSVLVGEVIILFSVLKKVNYR